MIEPDPARFYRLQTASGWQRVLADFADWTEPQPGWRSLDIGCGPGLLPGLLAARGLRSCGIDCDPQVYAAGRLHDQLALAEALSLPFPAGAFELVTASNLLFLLPDPLAALIEMRRLLARGGRLALLNPSEKMSVQAAARLADQRQLNDFARQTLLDWAQRAEAHRRWSEAETSALFQAGGLALERTALRIGPGLARLACGHLP